MSYWPEECSLKCQWLYCVAGMGIAGSGSCFLNGAWWMPCCPEFVDEDRFLEEAK